MKFVPLTAAALMAALAVPATAATLKLTATANTPTQSSDFTIVFDDLDGDMKLSTDEVVSFSGFTSFQIGQTYTDLLRISSVPSETDVAPTFTSSGFPITTWLFGEGTDRTTAQPSGFTYAISPIPLPATGLLLMVALGATLRLQRRA